MNVLKVSELVVVRHGGSASGTWFHEDVALEFARWLSPMFAIWCIGHFLKEIGMPRMRGRGRTLSAVSVGQSLREV